MVLEIHFISDSSFRFGLLYFMILLNHKTYIQAFICSVFHSLSALFLRSLFHYFVHSQMGLIFSKYSLYSYRYIANINSEAKIGIFSISHKKDHQHFSFPKYQLIHPNVNTWYIHTNWVTMNMQRLTQQWRTPHKQVIIWVFGKKQKNISLFDVY